MDKYIVMFAFGFALFDSFIDFTICHIGTRNIGFALFDGFIDFNVCHIGIRNIGFKSFFCSL